MLYVVTALVHYIPYSTCRSVLTNTYPTAGMSLITNVVILEHDSEKTPPSHQEVIETGQMRAIDMHRLVKGVIEKLAQASAKQSHETNGKD